MIPKKDLITTRSPHPDDLNFILSTFLRGLYHGNEFFKEIDHDSYFKNYHEVVSSLLLKPSVKVTIACLKNDRDVILGYSVTSPETLHWVFVKEAWRKIGLALDLIPPDMKQVTHLTKPGRAILHAKFPNVIFNPFALGG